MISSRIIESPIGSIYIEAEDGCLSVCSIEGQRHFKETCVLSFVIENEKLLDEVEGWLTRYFNKENPDPREIPLSIRGTEFQREVWELVQSIPYGERRTYGIIAKKISEKKRRKISPRAVGGAVGRNPISIIIPCHRVIGSNQDLVGYNGGLDKKSFLLQLEETH